MNTKFKKAVALSAAVIIGTSMVSVNAATLTKTLQATYNNIKVTFNGQPQTPVKEPFMIDGSVYVGLRDAGQLTNNNVEWDGSTKTVHITSKNAPSTGTDQELANKNLQIATLKSEVAELNKKVAQYEELLKEEEKKEEESTVSSKGIQNVLDVLEDDYDTYSSISWEYDLEATKDNKELELTISFDGDDDGDDFNELSDSKLEKHLKNVCSVVQKEFKNTPITGTVYDSDEKENVVTFTVSNSGKLKMKREMTTFSLKQFENELKGDYSNLPSTSTGEVDTESIKITSFKVDEDSNFSEIIVKIYTNFDDKLSSSWNNISSNDLTNIEDMIENICEEAEDTFDIEDDDFECYIYSGNKKLMIKYSDTDFSLRKL